MQYLGFDFGLRRIGVASGNSVSKLAQPLQTIHIKALADAWPAIEKLMREWQPQAVVVGVPYHPDGAAHENTARAQRFARQLQGRFGVPVFEVDERYSTQDVLQAGHRREVDAQAAALILQNHLDTLV